MLLSDTCEKVKKVSLPMYKVYIYYEDTDASGFVYHANYLKFMSRARETFLEKKLSLNFLADNQFFVLKNINIEYLKPSFHHDELTVSSQLFFTRSPRIKCFHEIIKKEQCIVKAHMDIVLVQKNTKPSRVNLLDYLV